MGLSEIWNESGGVTYHIRALRYRQRLWKDFRVGIESWLQGWRVDHSQPLILIGPSAGYCLPGEWLKKFPQIIAVDPDPLAHWIFRREHSELQVVWIRENFFSSGQSTSFETWLASYPGSAILFCNLLGQLKLVLDHPEERLSFWFERLEGILKGRAFASFHDRLSGHLPCTVPAQKFPIARLSNDALIERYYEGCKGELFDHETENVFPSTEKAFYWRWQIVPGTYHLIEGVLR